MNKNGWNLKDLGGALGVSAVMVHKYLGRNAKGRTQTRRPKTVDKIAAAFKTTAAELVAYSQEEGLWDQNYAVDADGQCIGTVGLQTHQRNSQAIADFLKYYKDQKGWSYITLGKHLGKTSAMARAYITQPSSNMRQKTVTGIATSFGMTPEDFMKLCTSPDKWPAFIEAEKKPASQSDRKFNPS